MMSPYVGIPNNPPPYAKLLYQGFQFSRTFFERFKGTVRSRGVLQLPSTARIAKLIDHNEEQIALGGIRVSPSEASELAGIEVISPGIWYKDGLVVSPRDLCAELFNHECIAMHSSSKVCSISLKGSYWEVTLGHGSSLTAPSIIFCIGYEQMGFPANIQLATEAVRGETISLSQSFESAKLKCAVSFNGYITPAVDGAHLVGAHYSHNSYELSPTESAKSEILTNLVRVFPKLDHLKSAPSKSWVGFRTSTHDRLPYVGEVLGMPRMYVSVGHGSRGCTTCPISAELIARLICGSALEDLSPLAVLMKPDRSSPRSDSPLMSTPHCAPSTTRL